MTGETALTGPSTLIRGGRIVMGENVFQADLLIRGEEIADLVAAGSPTIKCYMTYRDDGLLIEDPDLMRIASRLLASIATDTTVSLRPRLRWGLWSRPGPRRTMPSPLGSRAPIPNFP